MIKHLEKRFAELELQLKSLEATKKPNTANTVPKRITLMTMLS